MKTTELISVVIAAERLGVSVRRVQQFVAGRRLPAIRPGRDYLLDAADVKRFGLIPRRPGNPLRVRPRKRPPDRLA